MGGACSTCGGRKEVCTGFWCGILRTRDQSEDPGVDGSFTQNVSHSFPVIGSMSLCRGFSLFRVSHQMFSEACKKRCLPQNATQILAVCAVSSNIRSETPCQLLHCQISWFVDHASRYDRVKKNQLDAQLILSIFRQTLCVSGLSRPIIRRYKRMYTTVGTYYSF
jgi:hypothetical protein